MKKLIITLLLSLGTLTLVGCAGKKLSTPEAYLDNTTIKWNAVNNATQYKLYENDAVKCASLLKNEYQISVTESGTYKYYVIAVDQFGNYKESDKSNIVTYTYEKPAELKAPVATITENVISWNKVDTATGYNIFVDGSLYTSVTMTSYTLTYTEVGPHKVTIQSKRVNEVSEHSNAVTYKYTKGVTESTANEWDKSGIISEWTVKGKIETEVNEGFDMTAGSSAYVYREITNLNKFLRVSIRNFVRTGEISPKFYVEVDGDVIKAQDTDKDYVTLNSDAPIDFIYDLTSYMGKKVFIKFKETDATHCVITKVKMVKNVGPEITTNTSWINKESFETDWYCYDVDMSINEGPDYKGNGKSQLKTALTNENCIFNINWRMFVGQDIEGAKVTVKVNNQIIRANDATEDYVVLNHLIDTAQGFTYDFSNFIGQTVIIELTSINTNANHCVFLNASLIAKA